MSSFNLTAVIFSYKLRHTVAVILQQHFFSVPEHSAVADAKTFGDLGDG